MSGIFFSSYLTFFFIIPVVLALSDSIRLLSEHPHELQIDSIEHRGQAASTPFIKMVYEGCRAELIKTLLGESSSPLNRDLQQSSNPERTGHK